MRRTIIGRPHTMPFKLSRRDFNPFMWQYMRGCPAICAGEFDIHADRAPTVPARHVGSCDAAPPPFSRNASSNEPGETIPAAMLAAFAGSFLSSSPGRWAPGRLIVEKTSGFPAQSGRSIGWQVKLRTKLRLWERVGETARTTLSSGPCEIRRSSPSGQLSCKPVRRRKLSVKALFLANRTIHAAPAANHNPAKRFPAFRTGFARLAVDL